MIIYNVTTKVDWSIHEEWIKWMQNVHVKEVMETGCFTRYQLVKLLETDEEGGPTYAVQYFAESMEEYNRYIEHYADAFRDELYAKWSNKFISFRSLMQIVH